MAIIKPHFKSAKLEEYPHTRDYIAQLWRIRLIRTDYFNQEIKEIIDCLEKDIQRKNMRMCTSELLSELRWLWAFASKYVADTVLSDAYQCERPRHLEFKRKHDMPKAIARGRAA